MYRRNENRRIRFDLLKSYAYDGACFTCSSEEKLVFAHVRHTDIQIITRGRGRNQRFYDILHHPKAYRLMCHSCHKEFDDDPVEFVLALPIEVVAKFYSEEYEAELIEKVKKV